MYWSSPQMDEVRSLGTTDKAVQRLHSLRVSGVGAWWEEVRGGGWGWVSLFTAFLARGDFFFLQ